MDSSNDLHLYVDGQDQGVAAKDVTHPCFAVFNLSFVIQVRGIGTRQSSDALPVVSIDFKRLLR